MESARLASGTTIALLRPARVLGPGHHPIRRRRTGPEAAEKKKLLQQQSQGKLFAAKEATAIATLRKIPYDFHYRCVYIGSDGVEVEARHKISDWEIGALYWNVRDKHGDKWEQPFRDKVQTELPSKNLMFLMGTIHRFPDQWLVISVIYPPKPPAEPSGQLSLL